MFELESPIPIEGNRLAGKTALISGAGSEGRLCGTGAAMAILFAAQGANVGVFDSNPRRAENTVARITQAGGKAVAIAGDVRNADDCRAAVAAVVGRYGSISVLVNNAALSANGGVSNTSDEEWSLLMDVNLKGTVNMIAAAAPQMRAQPGSIINLSSIAAQIALGGIAYTASKGGILSLTHLMAKELGPDGIRVNCIVPGHIVGPMGATSPEARKQRLGLTMLGTEGTVWDVAWAALYLASDEARWITAATLQVDAGSPLVGPRL